jgi:hypothetical protein
MTTTAQLYLNELGDQREFAERLTAKDAEIALLHASRDEWTTTAVQRGLELEDARAEITQLREEGSQIDAALEVWFNPGEFPNRVAAVQGTARIWDGIVEALDIGDNDDDPVIKIKEMVEYIGDLDAILATQTAEIARLREALKWYAADSDEKFQIVDSKGEFIASFGEFSARAQAALREE